jgi:iron complex outermembrane receptor protein
MKTTTLSGLFLLSLAGASVAAAAEVAQGQEAGLEEVIVTARQRAESLQDVPDSITAFTASAIREAGIGDLQGFIDKTPNIFLKQGARAGNTYITVRGVSTGQNGWAPVTFVVDGIPTATIEGLNQGTLFDLERVEILKGPQSALYGAGAIAGAINLITRAPGDELDGRAQLSIARGNDVRTDAALTGPLGEHLKFRVAGSYRTSDGVFKDTDGDGLDIQSHKAVRARVVGDFSSLSIDLRAFAVDSRPGAYMQEALPTTDPAELAKLIDNFDTRPARGIIGREKRHIREFSGKIAWHTAIGELAVLGGHSEIDQHGFGSSTWLKPPAPDTFCGPVGGPAQPPDCFQDNVDNVTTSSVDVRLTSPDAQRVRWLFGAAYLERKTLNSFRLGAPVEDANGHLVMPPPPYGFDSDHLRHDEFAGVYGQVNIDLTKQTELTLAGRWDRNDYDSTQYTDQTLTTPVPTSDGLITQTARDSKFQPKAQLSYHWTPDVMSYISVARGFRTGFFNSGALTAPETTTNYELGLKSVGLEGRLSINTALYHIDYSDQQFTFITPNPPFRASTNIPKTSIDGAEVEIAARPSARLSLTAAVGVSDARVADGTEAPNTPKYTFNLGASYEYPVTASLAWRSRVDFRRQGAYYLEQGNAFSVDPKDFINLRTSLNWNKWSVGLWVENLLDERQVGELAIFSSYSIRLSSLPRTYGIEFQYGL